MKKNKEYLRAAQMLYLSQNEGFNITRYRGICGTLRVKEMQAVRELFEPEGHGAYWWGEILGNNINEENQTARTIALLLMYEMGEP